MFSIALSAVDGEECTNAFLSSNPIPTINVRAVAIGKAAAAMMQGAIGHLGESLRSGLVITKQDNINGQFDQRITCLESDHPIPSERSLAAGAQLVQFIEQVGKDELLLVLISGGTSALVEVLDKTITVEQLVSLNEWCISNPYSISEINALRSSISKIKAGRLLNYLHTDHVIQLTISDVQDNDLKVIGSGLFVANVPVGINEIISSGRPPLPDWLRSFMRDHSSAASESMPKAPVKIEHHIVADNQAAREAITLFASQQEISVRLNQEMYLELKLAAENISTTLMDGEPGLYIWGGECVLTLPDNPGQGGRCQSLALAIAEYIKGLNIIVLVAATDGNDGSGEAAGALVDGLTIQRGGELGLDAAEELDKANAGYFLAETGDLLDTGPTNTNVMDVVIALKYPS